MAMLDLRSEEPISESTDEILPDETPPGLEAIRAWIRKPRPWLHGVKLWIRQFAKWWRAFRKWAAENAVPAARRATELAAGGAKAARGLAKAAGIAADAGKQIAEMGRGWRHAGGRSGRIAAAVATRAGQFRDFSIGAVRTARNAAAIGDAVSRFREMLPRRKTVDAGPAAEHDDSGPARRLVPVVPRPTPKTPPEPVPETPPKPVPKVLPEPVPETPPKPVPKTPPEPVPEAPPEPVPKTLPEPVPKTPPKPVPKTPPEPVPEALEAGREPASEPPEAQQEPLPENPGTLPEPAPDPITASHPERPATPPVEAKGPVETPRPSASAAPPKEARRAEALAKLPWPFRARIDALNPRTRKPVLWPLIVDILKERGSTTSSELALLLGMDSRSLTRRHLMPMVKARVLARLFPERPRHPDQAYQVRSADSPPPGGTGVHR